MLLGMGFEVSKIQTRPSGSLMWDVLLYVCFFYSLMNKSVGPMP